MRLVMVPPYEIWAFCCWRSIMCCHVLLYFKEVHKILTGRSAQRMPLSAGSWEDKTSGKCIMHKHTCSFASGLFLWTFFIGCCHFAINCQGMFDLTIRTLKVQQEIQSRFWEGQGNPRGPAYVAQIRGYIPSHINKIITDE